MEINNFVFVLLSVVTLLCAMGVVLVKNPIHSGLYLVLTMFSIAGHYVLLSAQFVAVVNVIVYAGAVMVLLLFVMMLLNLNKENEPLKSFKVKMLGAYGEEYIVNRRTYFYEIPELEKCREQWDKHHGGPFKWTVPLHKEEQLDLKNSEDAFK